MSREENQGVQDERVRYVSGVASRVGMVVGGLVCVALVLLSEFLLGIPEIGLTGWLVYFSMWGSRCIALYVKLKDRSCLLWGIVEIVISIAFAAALIYKSVV